VVPRDHWPTAGWRTAAPKDHGTDSAALSAIEDQVPKAYSHVRSFLLVRQGQVYEHYWNGLDQTSGRNVWSVTKSVIGALVDIALADGKLKSLDQTVGELLAAQLPKDADPRFAGVTVRHLLTMTSGLASDDDRPRGDPGLRDAMVMSLANHANSAAVAFYRRADRQLRSLKWGFEPVTSSVSVTTRPTRRKPIEIWACTSSVDVVQTDSPPLALSLAPHRSSKLLGPSSPAVGCKETGQRLVVCAGASL
jgi:CubicO group peptidase (beta-lactamase class C family)